MTRISRSLNLPDGYQKMDLEWYGRRPNEHGVSLDSMPDIPKSDERVYVYTQHQIFYEDGMFKQTRSSPNWEGGMVTYSTCKHNMRCYNVEDWTGIWICGLTPKHCEDNSVLFLGRISKEFPSNYDLGQWIKKHSPDLYDIKAAVSNPRGDLYQPVVRKLEDDERYDHTNFIRPSGHTRSVEKYSHSPGSESDRKDGKIPKWWRDIEYFQRGIRPPSFILSPCWLFSNPLLGLTKRPGRAVLRTTTTEFREWLVRKNKV